MKFDIGDFFENQNLATIQQNYWAIYMKAKICVIFASDIKLS